MSCFCCDILKCQLYVVSDWQFKYRTMGIEISRGHFLWNTTLMLRQNKFCPFFSQIQHIQKMIIWMGRHASKASTTSKLQRNNMLFHSKIKSITQGDLILECNFTPLWNFLFDWRLLLRKCTPRLCWDVWWFRTKYLGWRNCNIKSKTLLRRTVISNQIFWMNNLSAGHSKKMDCEKCIIKPKTLLRRMAISNQINILVEQFVSRPFKKNGLWKIVTLRPKFKQVEILLGTLWRWQALNVVNDNLALKKLRYVLKCLLDKDVFLVSNNYTGVIKPQQRTAKK